MSYSTTLNFLKSIISFSFILVFAIFLQNQGNAQSLSFPSSQYGISFGNSQNFTGLRFNWSDRNVKKVTGINITLWTPGDNEQAEMTGVNLGLMPSGGNVTGMNFGFLGIAAENNLKGINLGLIGVGACLLYTSPSPRDRTRSRMPSSA